MATELESTPISLKSADGHIHEVSPAIAKQMQTLQSFIEEESFVASTVIPTPNVNSVDLSKIIEYLNYHHREDKASATSNEEKKEFNAQFVKELSNEQLLKLILAANYLNVKDLLDFLSQTVADLIQNKSVEYVRKLFGIVGDFTEEEERQIRKDNSWAFEGVVDQD